MLKIAIVMRMPTVAPKWSIALSKPKFLPRSCSFEMSATIASLGAPLIFPNLSRTLNGIRWGHAVENA